MISHDTTIRRSVSHSFSSVRLHSRSTWRPTNAGPDDRLAFLAGQEISSQCLAATSLDRWSGFVVAMTTSS
jgi:hypothetical protein